MLAHHPKTGAPIRILQTETHLWKNQRTLAVVRSQEDIDRVGGRWKTVAPAPLPADYTLSLTVSEGLVPFFLGSSLDKGADTQRGLHIMTREVYTALSEPLLTRRGYQNLLILEDIAELYPHLGFSYGPETTELQCLQMIQALLRFPKLVLDVQSEPPAPLWFITQTYTPKQAKRGRELSLALRENLDNPFVDRVVLLQESLLGLEHPKLVQTVIGTRITYAHVLQYIKDEVPPGTIVVFANADISTDATLKEVWSVDLSRTCLALLRHERDTGDLFGPRADSQDCWIVTADSVKQRTFSDAFQIPFGKNGCDNAFALLMLKERYTVANPALTIRTWHHHASGLRTYDPQDVVESPAFLYLDPTAIHEMELAGLGAREEISDAPVSYRIDPAASPVFFSMAKRDGWDFAPFVPPKQSLHRFQNAFVTPTGIVYDTCSLKIGKNETLKEMCATASMSPLTTSYAVDCALAVPLDDETARDPYAYIVRYVSKILRLRDAGHKGDFWVSPSEVITDVLQNFVWSGLGGPLKELPVLPREDCVAFGKEVVMRVPQTKGYVPSCEDIAALRGASRDWFADKRPSTVALLGLADPALEAFFRTQGCTVEVLRGTEPSRELFYRLCGCGLVIAAYGFKNLFWCLPPDATVLEVQSELSVRGDSAQMCAACSCDYMPLLKPRGAKASWLTEAVGNWMGTKARRDEATAQRDDTNALQLILPTGWEGFQGHAGDSFRELARLWAEKGFVRITESRETPFCWLGGIGKTLLYDRPTWDWIQPVAPAYERMLVGNPSPTVPRSFAWFFWPRRPALVERLAEDLPGWSARPRTLVFYGRVENAVQKKFRSSDLLKACDDASMPIAVGREAEYAYSQEEYLRRLKSAKFGLCLRGFGPKCHREVECMAMGTVPVVAPDVDMLSYAEPPIAGVHYLELASYNPEEARRLVENVSEDAWAALSAAAHAWWKRNASVEGSWDLTQRLLKN